MITYMIDAEKESKKVQRVCEALLLTVPDRWSADGNRTCLPTLGRFESIRYHSGLYGSKELPAAIESAHEAGLIEPCTEHAECWRIPRLYRRLTLCEIALGDIAGAVEPYGAAD